MRELTVRIKFTKHCLGSVKCKHGSGRFFLPRSPSGAVTFMASWHYANLRFAVNLLNKHQDEISKIHWDIAVDGSVRSEHCWHRRYYAAANKARYVLHESFLPGQIVGINCVVPSVISDEDLWQLLSLAGRYRGLSPYMPGTYGTFDVESIRPRRQMEVETQAVSAPSGDA